MSSFTNAPGAPEMEVADSFGPPGGSFDFEPLVETQPDETQPSSQELRKQKAELWGYLHPCGPDVQKVEFIKQKFIYCFGRNTANHVVLPGIRISNYHCEIKWDGTNVVVEDKSSNGTFIAGQKIGKGNSRVLREGNELSLGGTPADGSTDYRWLYRHYGNGDSPTRQGFWTKYDMGDRLGQGAFATVYKAMEVATGKWYAVKDIQRARPLGATAHETQFMREIRIMTEINHPNIVHLHGVFEEDNNLYLVMELVEGGELLRRILESNGLKERETCRIAYQVCKAMSYIHEQGICHRDLKPENILLTKDDPPIAKVADFGLAKMVDGETFLKTMCGTPAYLAPEVVLRGPDNRYNDRVDSWSLGVIVYAMLMNSSPFVEDEELPLKDRIERRQINWAPFHYSASYCVDFMRQLLETEPANRMSLTAALEHPWFVEHGFASSRYLESSDRENTSSPLSDQDPYKLSMTSYLSGAGQELSALDCSQEFKNLNLNNRPDLDPGPPYTPEKTSSGNIIIPGFERPPSKKANTMMMDNGHERAGPSNDIPVPVSNGRAHSRPPSEGESEAMVRKRKTPPGSMEDGDSSPLSSAPSEHDGPDSDEDLYGPHDKPKSSKSGRAVRMKMDTSPPSKTATKPASKGTNGKSSAKSKKTPVANEVDDDDDLYGDGTPVAGPSTRTRTRARNRGH